RNTLVIGQSLADGKFGSALAGVMLSYVMNVMYRRLRNPQHNWTPTYILCDEAPRLKNIDYEEITAIGRGAKASVFLMCQSLDQFPEKTLPALNNCRTQIFLQGVSYKTSDWLSQQLGEYQRRVLNMSAQGIVGPSPLNQRSINYERVPVLAVREISNRPLDDLPSTRSAIVRINASQTPSSKPFLTDYST
ncbi:MAG: TraM recognition domain-containing protein, partial [Planktothrix sp.]